MALLLLIDTAVSGGSISLSRNGTPVGFLQERMQKGTASWLHPAIAALLEGAGHGVKDLDGVAVSAGPGSYTGLRVGLSAAKGLCYALDKPLILLNTLEMLAGPHLHKGLRVAPMIDARRMEVFTALFDAEGRTLLPSGPLVLEAHSFDAYLGEGPVLFCGNGSPKWKELCSHPQAQFSGAEGDARHLAPAAEKAYREGAFASLAYAEPFYGKEFHAPPPKRIV